MSSNVIFYAESASGTNNKSVGLGHIFRLYPVFKSLKKKNKDASFVIPIDKARLNTLRIDSAQTIEPGLSAILTYIIDVQPDVVVLDGYDILESLASNINEKSLAKIVVFDDHYKLKSVVDTVINLSPYTDASLYNDKIKSLLLGPEYAPVIDEINTARNKYKISSSIKKIFLALGGNDAMSNVDKLINSLSKIIPSSVEVHVVGENMPRVNISGFKYIGWKSPEELSEMSCQYDLAILGGGSMLYQFACVGIPMICWPQTPKQLSHAEKWENSDALCVLRNMEDLSNSYKLMNSFEKRQTFYNTSRNIVDGMGAERIVNHILDTSI